MTEQTFVPGDPRGVADEQGETITLLDGTVTVEHRFTVPVDHAQSLAEARAHDEAGTGLAPGGAGTLTVFAREFRASDSAEDAERPWLLYLQGGPGSGGTRPACMSEKSLPLRMSVLASWMKAISSAGMPRSMSFFRMSS